jgi:hypothetical protein
MPGFWLAKVDLPAGGSSHDNLRERSYPKRELSSRGPSEFCQRESCHIGMMAAGSCRVA